MRIVCLERLPMSDSLLMLCMTHTFILTGIVAMAAATRQHRRNLVLLARADFTYVPQTSIGTGTALALMAIGTVSLLMLIWGALS